MKVEVSILKRPDSGAATCQVRRRRKGYCVQIPVRVIRPDGCISEETENDFFEPRHSADLNEPCACTSDLSGLPESHDTAIIDAAAPSNVTIGFAADSAPSETEEEPLPPVLPDPDEEELLAMIAEEEAEMESMLSQEDGMEEEEPLEDFDKTVASEFFGESADGDPAPSSDRQAASSHYVRYFDRSTSGERVEVETSDATGQEIICVDEQSGRISRVCGFIRNNSHAAEDENTESSAEDEVSSDDE